MTKNTFHRRRWYLRTLGNGDESDTGGAIASIRRKRGRRKRGDGDLQLMFPEMQVQHEDTTSTNEDEEQIHTAQKQAQYTTKSVRSVSCILNLERTGKFTLSLAEGDNHDRKSETDTESHEPPGNSRLLGQSISPIHQSVKGEWYLTPNPYCATDRHYDTLLLVSQPRMRRRSTMIEKATVELRCKVWGRYGAGAVRGKLGYGHGRVMGRMTHGTVVIVKEKVDDVSGASGGKLPTREVVASFHGSAIVDLDSVEGTSRDNADKPAVGDEEDDDDLDFDDNFDEFGVLRPIEHR